jgi:hypothetical protein
MAICERQVHKIKRKDEMICAGPKAVGRPRCVRQPVNRAGTPPAREIVTADYWGALCRGDDRGELNFPPSK